jgi:hypothetical protein
MDFTVLQHSVNVPLDDPRALRIAEIHAKGLEASEEEREEMMRLILNLKALLPK